MLSGGLSEWEDRIATVAQSAFARDNHWRTASRVTSFINDLSILLGKIDDVVDHAAPSLVFLRCLPVDVQCHGEIGQKATDGLEPVARRQIRLSNDKKINVALLGCIAASITSEKNDLFGIEAAHNAMEHAAKFRGSDHRLLFGISWVWLGSVYPTPNQAWPQLRAGGKTSYDRKMRDRKIRKKAMNRE